MVSAKITERRFIGVELARVGLCWDDELKSDDSERPEVSSKSEHIVSDSVSDSDVELMCGLKYEFLLVEFLTVEFLEIEFMEDLLEFKLLAPEFFEINDLLSVLSEFEVSLSEFELSEVYFFKIVFSGFFLEIGGKD